MFFSVTFTVVKLTIFQWKIETANMFQMLEKVIWMTSWNVCEYETRISWLITFYSVSIFRLHPLLRTVRSTIIVNIIRNEIYNKMYICTSMPKKTVAIYIFPRSVLMYVNFACTTAHLVTYRRDIQLYARWGYCK